MNANDIPYDLPPACFQAASVYRNLTRQTPALVKEPEPTLEPFTERHLHCIWYDPKHRPATLRSARGETVEILHPGEWNHESGPDFRNAEWTVEGRRYHGDVEIHIRPMDWCHHQHQNDPRYNQVMLHVTYEPGELPSGTLPIGCTEVALKDELEQRSHFYFEGIDLSAYPWDREGTISGIRTWFASHSEDECGHMLDAAGQERIRRKTLRMSRLIHSVGSAQALYQSLMRGLGYKGNADNMETLARYVPLSLLRSYAGSQARESYALLTGCAGLLPDEESSGYFPGWFSIRSLWDFWWRNQEPFSTNRMQRQDWNLDHCRPGNQPARRLWAAAHWFCQTPSPEQEWMPRDSESSPDWIRRIRNHLEAPPPIDPEANFRIIGPQRAATLLVNAVIPWRICSCPEPPSPDIWQHLPSEPLNSKTRKAALRFFGRDTHPRLFNTALRRQGLLQLHEDYGG
jgi:hypothetical protein